MNPATITAISGAAVAILTAVTALVKVIRHGSDSDAHTQAVADPTDNRDTSTQHPIP